MDPDAFADIIPQTSGGVELRIDRSEFAASGELEFFTVSVRGPSCTGTRRVYLYRGEGLVELFEGLAREPRGWTGARAWESIQGDCALSCTADHLGHVTIEVRLCSWQPEFWELSCSAQTELGQLEAIARARRRFFDAR